MLRQPLGERAAPLDGYGQLGQNFLECGAFLLFLQHPQTAQQRQTGIHQGRQLPGKSRQHLGFHPAAQTGDLDVDIYPVFAPLGRTFGRRPLFRPFHRFLVGLDNFDREQIHVLYPADGVILIGHFDRALRLIAAGIQRCVIVFRHGGQVYLTTSSMVVSPSKIPRKPSSRNEVMPNSMAFWRTTTVGARSLMRLRIWSETTKSS